MSGEYLAAIQRAQAGVCSHGGHGWDGDTCDEIPLPATWRDAQVGRVVAAGVASTVESAAWSVDYGSGYSRGKSDANAGRRVDLAGSSAGYAAGFAWVVRH